MNADLRRAAREMRLHHPLRSMARRDTEEQLTPRRRDATKNKTNALEPPGGYASMNADERGFSMRRMRNAECDGRNGQDNIREPAWSEAVEAV